MASDEPACPVCKQPVDMVVRRHKTLGVFVPVWAPGPCHNSRCASYQEGDESEETRTGPDPAASGTGTSGTGPGAGAVLMADPGTPEVPPAAAGPDS
ncbi:hypothetical protein ACLVWQ_08555 [Streptomyces sp. CWNU-52B]|uniref:hypothetical protein n=1 Tax=unclassified Streptomyces TaxID=2593676 RepID=UPI0039BFCCCE